MRIQKDNICFFLIDNVKSSFEIQEVENLVKRVDKVVILSRTKLILPAAIQAKAETHVIAIENYSFKNYAKRSICYFPLFIFEFFSCYKYATNFRLFKIKISSFMRSMFVADNLFDYYQLYKTKDNTIIFYSFWLNDWATALAILKKKIPTIRIISRVHGGDLFEERVPVIKKIAFRSFQLKYMDKVFSVSKAGMNYMKTRYPKYGHKIKCFYMGTKDGDKGPFSEQSVFTIVSCAYIRDIKRIHLLAESLQNIDFPIRWIHIGGEIEGDKTLPLLYSTLEKLKKEKENIEFQMIGAMNNEDIFKFYKSHSVNLFISVSETEGLPVSMMEASSFGIPILSTDVGGCSEIVTADTGLLISKNSTAEEIAFHLMAFKKSVKNKHEFHNNVRKFWKEKFENENNFSRFISENKLKQ